MSVLAEVRYLDKYAQFNDGFHFLLFRPKITFLSKFGVKNQNCHFKQNLVSKTNLNMQNSWGCSLFLFL